MEIHNPVYPVQIFMNEVRVCQSHKYQRTMVCKVVAISF